MYYFVSNDLNNFSHYDINGLEHILNDLPSGVNIAVLWDQPSTIKSTKDRAPVITGTAEIGSEVSLYFNSDQLLGTGITDYQGNWSIAPNQLLANGTHILKAISKDHAGNTSVSANLDVIVDSSLNSQNIPTIRLNLFNNSTPTFTGSAEANSYVRLLTQFDGKEGETTIGETTADHNGLWQISVDTNFPLTDSSYSLFPQSFLGRISGVKYYNRYCNYKSKNK